MKSALKFEKMLREYFEQWYYSIKDQQMRKRILLTLKKVSMGNLSDGKTVGNKVFELRIDLGPGYRIYFSRIGNMIFY